MSRAGVVPPPPWSPPSDLLDAALTNSAYHFIRFDAQYRQGSEMQELMVALRRLPETILLLQMSDGYGDVYALILIPDDHASDRRMSDLIDVMAGQRIYNRVRTGWTRVGNEMIRFAK